MRKNNEFLRLHTPALQLSSQRRSLFQIFRVQFRDPKNNGIWALETTDLHTSEGGENNGIGAHMRYLVLNAR
jgi:hypothetical protein